MEGMNKKKKASEKVARVLGAALAASSPAAAQAGSNDFPMPHHHVEGRGRTIGEALEDLHKKEQDPKVQEQMLRDKLQDYGMDYDSVMKKSKEIEEKVRKEAEELRREGYLK